MLHRPDFHYDILITVSPQSMCGPKRGLFRQVDLGNLSCSLQQLAITLKKPSSFDWSDERLSVFQPPKTSPTNLQYDMVTFCSSRAIIILASWASVDMIEDFFGAAMRMASTIFRPASDCECIFRFSLIP